MTPRHSKAAETHRTLRKIGMKRTGSHDGDVAQVVSVAATAFFDVRHQVKATMWVPAHRFFFVPD